MKKFLIFVFLLSFCFQMKAQLVVSDPTNTAVNKAGWIESLAKAGAQVQTLLDQKSLLSQSINMYMKVSKVISDNKMVYSMIDRQVKFIAGINKEMMRTDVISVIGYEHYKSILRELSDTNKSNLEFLQTIVSPDSKMTDADRFKLMRDLDKDSKAVVSKFYSEKDRYNEFNDNLKMIKSLQSTKQN